MAEEIDARNWKKTEQRIPMPYLMMRNITMPCTVWKVRNGHWYFS